MISHIYFLVEEESAAVALYNLVPKIIGHEIKINVIRHQGKHDLLSKLPGRLKGYSKWLPPDGRIVVLVDEDRLDCIKLKHDLEEAAKNAGLVTKTTAAKCGYFQVLNRIAIEELEAWFFGDVEALNRSYSRIPRSLGTKTKYKNPDAINGGTWEALERELQGKGYFKGGLPKIEVARTISAEMNPDHNRSKSFQVFMDGLREMVG
jgi:hypothetical protein